MGDKERLPLSVTGIKQVWGTALILKPTCQVSMFQRNEK